MDINEEGASRSDEAPKDETANDAKFQANNSAKLAASTHSQGFTGGTKFSQVREQLAQYMNLGLVPIPLRGKEAKVKWKTWCPKSVASLEPYIRGGFDWGVRTGGYFTVLDFDTVTGYQNFMLANAGKLPDNTPIVKTGRAYHIWLQTTKQVRSQHYEGFDIKGEGGYVVAPPSIHANGNQYTFIRPLLQELPVVDFDSLVLPRVKPDYEARATTKFNPSEWKLVPGNMVDLINNGAPEGQRHNVLVSYLGALIGRGLSKELVSEYVVLWNDEKNKPPLPLVEVLSTTESCWKSYADRVSTKTHTNNYSVLIETRRAQKEKAEACQKLLEELRAKEKATELPHASMCGKRHAISRQGKKYLSVAFFCGSWNCPRCANYFRTRWLNHLGEVTNGSILFITNIVSRDWDCFRRRLNRAGCEYVRIYDYGHSTVITNKAVPGSNPIPEGQLAERLEALIPHKFEFSPVSTSRGWQLEKKVKDPEKETATLVTRTFLPIDVQQAIAKQLGATLDGERRWVSPENEDAQEWENKFTSELAKHEAHIWSETVKKKKSLEGWVDDFNKVMEAEDVFDGHRERWEVIAG